MCAHSVIQSCPTLCNPMDCSPPGSLSMGFSKQEYWNGLSFPSPRDLFNPGIKHVSYIPCIGRWILSHSFLSTPFFLPYMYKNMVLFLFFSLIIIMDSQIFPPLNVLEFPWSSLLFLLLNLSEIWPLGSPYGWFLCLSNMTPFNLWSVPCFPVYDIPGPLCTFAALETASAGHSLTDLTSQHVRRSSDSATPDLLWSFLWGQGLGWGRHKTSQEWGWWVSPSKSRY